MIREITIEQCPQCLRDEVSKMQDRLPMIEIVAVRKLSSTPYVDKSISVTTYKPKFRKPIMTAII